MTWKRVYFVRHGQVESNRRLALIGRRDEGLTAEGGRQAKALSRMLAEVPVEAVYSSPLQRTRDTATPIAEVHGLAPVEVPALIEQAYGDWEGVELAELAARGPQEAERVRAWRRDSTQAPPGGESLAAVQERVVAWVDSAVEASGSGSLVAVTHVGPIKVVVCQVLNASLGAVTRFFVDTGTITVVDWGRPPVLRIFNARQELNEVDLPPLRGRL